MAPCLSRGRIPDNRFAMAQLALRLVPDDGYFGRDPTDPAERIPARGYAVADAAGNKLGWKELSVVGLHPFPLELDDPSDDRLRDPRLDPGRLLKLTPDKGARPLPRVRVWDAAGSWRIGYLGVSFWGDSAQLLSQWRTVDQFSAIVLLEGILDGKRIHELVLVGQPAMISLLYSSIRLAPKSDT
jgi:hypothetical protein